MSARYVLCEHENLKFDAYRCPYIYNSSGSAVVQGKGDSFFSHIKESLCATPY